MVSSGSIGPTSSHASSATRPGDDILRLRPRLLGLAYRMLSDMDDAEDVVQEAYLRWHQQDRADVRSAEAWLVTVVTRAAVDRLRRAAIERATYIGPWLPEPIATEPAPDHGAEIESDLSVALLVLLERLAPEERAAFLLREVFGTDYAEIARILERRPDAVRQMVHRARERVHAGRPRVSAPPEVDGQLVERFIAALAADDAPALLALLAPGVTMTSDGGGRVPAARRIIGGADEVARVFLALARKVGHRITSRPTRLNGQPALVWYEGERLVTAMVLDVDGDRIAAVYIVRNPDKLRRAAGAGYALE
jgi:RNA polymerase sigma-70 factor (ECF subfamily)